MTDPSNMSTSLRADNTAERLESWKEIAQYLKRDESTAQRWEKREGMPVHRHVHDKRGSVYAFRSELDLWWANRGRLTNQTPASGDETSIPETLAPPNGAARSGKGWASDRRLRVAAIVSLLAGSLGLAWRLSSATTALSRIPTLIRMTSTTGLNIDPALSLDGSLLAYASDRGDSDELDIWIQPTTSETPIRVTRQPGDELEPSFAPDGASLVFSKGEGGGIYIVGTTGGEPRQIVSSVRAHSPRFSPDGRLVTYWTGPPVWNIPGASRASGTQFVISATGGPSRPIAPQLANAWYGTWSPDGSKILLIGESRRAPNDSTVDWYIVDVDGGEPTRTGAVEALKQAGVKGVPVPAAWTNDGVVFANYDQGASNVWWIAVSPSGRITGRPERLTFGTAIERSPSVNAAGRLAFSSVVEDVDVWRIPLDPKSGVASGPPERVTRNAASDRMLNASDDGHLITFVSSRTGRDEVWVRDLRKQQDRQITSTHSDNGRISRDGSMIAIRTGESPASRVEVVPVGGGPAAPLCDDCGPVDWSPDGSRLLLARPSPAVHLVMRDRASSRETELAAHDTWNLLQARFSPDGRWVVFHTTNTPTLRQVYAVPTFSNAPVPIDQWTPVVTDFGIMPNWSPDGAAVYHFSLRDGAFCAWLQPVDPQTKRPIGAPRPVQHLHSPRLQAVSGAIVTSYVAAGYLYATLTESSGNIWMLDR